MEKITNKRLILSKPEKRKVYPKILKLSKWQKTLLDKETQIRNLYKHCREITDYLTSNDLCSHQLTKPFEWEHDSGYGRQTRMVGVQCCICKKVKYWNSKYEIWSKP
jgi:hypothetical protein